MEITNAHMVGAMYLISVQRGYDPRSFVLVAFGGAGPLPANALGRDLDIPTVLIPLSPGIASALDLSYRKEWHSVIMQGHGFTV